MKELKTWGELVQKIYLFLLVLRIRIKLLSQEEFIKLLNEISTEQKIYAIYFRIL